MFWGPLFLKLASQTLASWDEMSIYNIAIYISICIYAYIHIQNMHFILYVNICTYLHANTL